MADSKELIVKALENNLPMNDFYNFKGHTQNILSQSGQLLIKFEPIINGITDSKMNIPCLFAKLSEKTMCINPESIQCSVSKTNRELICQPVTAIKNKVQPLLQKGGNYRYNSKTTKNIKNIKIYKKNI